MDLRSRDPYRSSSRSDDCFRISPAAANPDRFCVDDIGVLLLAADPLQERLELKMEKEAAWSEDWKRPILYTLLEEGSETFAAIACMCAMLLCARQTLAKEPSRRVTYHWQGTECLRAGLSLTGALAIAMVVTYVAIPHPTLDDGIPHNWFPSINAFLSFVLFLVLLSRELRPTWKIAYFVAAILSLFLSMFWGANLHSYHHLTQLDWLRELLYAGLYVSITGASCFLVVTIRDPGAKLLAILWAVLLLLALRYFRAESAILSFAGFAALFISLLPRLQIDTSRQA